MIHEQIIKRLLDESKEDCLALWWIIGYAAQDTGREELYDEDDPSIPHPNTITDDVVVKAKTLALVRDLLNTRRLQAGYLAGGGERVDPWRIPTEAVVERIDREWTTLGKEPDMEHDVCWLGECTPEQWPHGG